VQRVPEGWPVVHLEATPPEWTGLRVDGLVRHRRHLGLSELAALGSERRVIPFHCVWGWSKPTSEWEGVAVAAVLELAGATGSHATIHAASGVYSACLTVADAASGFLAWSRAGARLDAEAGGPLRFVPPPTLWAYKGVKWAARIELVDRFVPGFWESRIDDPEGRIPEDVERP
jgi:DMSO/TMAO reductase YedYZ molybdopterin-dependent catalytic subunit